MFLITIYTFVMLTLFSTVWNQYARGFFELGTINPVDEGLPALGVLVILSQFLDPTFYKTWHWVGQYNQ